MRKKRDERQSAGDERRPPRWLRLAQTEVELRKQVSQFKRDTSVAGEFAQGEIKPQKKADARSEREATLDRELQMQAKMRVKYPRIPAELEAEFLDRIKAGGFSWDSWGEAVKWLESTVWFTQHSKI